jgi:hypothetical protein
VTAARLVAATRRTDETVSVDPASIVGSDADAAESGDTVAYAYRWLVNGAVVAALDGDDFERRFVSDSVACEVTPMTAPPTAAPSLPAPPP